MFKFLKQIARNKKKRENKRKAKATPRVYPDAPEIDFSNLSAGKFEFLLKRASIQDGEFSDEFKLKSHQDWIKVLTPDSIDWFDVSNDNGFAIRIKDFTYGISVEMAGLQFGFEGNVKFPEAKKIMLELKHKIEVHSGHKAELLEFNR